MSRRLKLISDHLTQYSLITHQILEQNIGVIKFNRPKVLNSLNGEIFQEINAVLDQYEHNDNIKVVILTGSEKAFAAGADINGFLPATPETAIKHLFLDLFPQKLNFYPKPIIAAVNGFALGGGLEVAMSCDIIIANQNAKFGQPEINLGIIPGVGGTQRLSRAIGKNASMEYFFSGKMFTAQEAFEYNLISDIAEEDAFEKALVLARKIKKYQLPTLMWMKRSLLGGMETGAFGGYQQDQVGFAASLSLLKNSAEGQPKDKKSQDNQFTIINFQDIDSMSQLAFTLYRYQNQIEKTCFSLQQYPFTRFVSSEDLLIIVQQVVIHQSVQTIKIFSWVGNGKLELIRLRLLDYDLPLLLLPKSFSDLQEILEVKDLDSISVLLLGYTPNDA